MHCHQYFQEFVSLLAPNSCSFLKISALFFSPLKELPGPVSYPEKTEHDQCNATSLKAKYTDLKEYVVLKHHYH